MKIRSTLVMLVLIGTGCGSPADDLDAICEEATKLQSGEPPYADPDPASRMVQFAQSVESRLKSKQIKSAFEAMASSSPEERYQILQAAGKEAGVENWQCPALVSPQRPEAEEK